MLNGVVTVEPLRKGPLGDLSFVLFLEVILLSEIFDISIIMSFK